MKNIILRFLIFSGVFICYLLFASINMSNNDIYRIKEYFKIGNNSKSMKTKKDTGYFFSEKECGYFSFNEGFGFLKKVQEDQFILANNYFYLTYNKIGESINVFSPDGKEISKIRITGYPYISGDFPFFYVLKTNGSGFSTFSMTGDVLLDNIKYTSMISSISTDKYLNTLISTIDGKSYLYSSDGDLLHTIVEKDSEIVISKSNTIEHFGDKIAICSGINPEYIILYQKSSGKLITKFETDTNFRYKIFMKFANDKIYYEGIDSIKYYDMKKKKHGYIKNNGVLKEIVFSSNGYILTVTSDGVLYYLMIYTPDGEKKYYKDFISPVTNFNFFNKRDFYFKLNDKIVIATVGGSI